MSSLKKKSDALSPNSENAALLKWFMVGLLAFGFMAGIFALYGSLSVRAKAEDKIYSKYQRPNYIRNKSSSDVTVNDPLDRAKYLFSVNKFEESKSVLNDIVTKVKNGDTLNQTHFYLAHVYINIGEISKARKQLDLCSEKTELHKLFTE